MTKQWKTRFAYISVIFPSGKFRNFKLDMDVLENVNKLRNLKAGSITTFTMTDDDPSFRTANKGDTIEEQTLTIYPANVATIEVKIVESTHIHYESPQSV